MKRIVCFVLALVICFLFAGCKSEVEITQEQYAALKEDILALQAEAARMEEEIAQLESRKASLENEILDINVENGTAKYVVTFDIRQSHFSFDLADHLKDSMNAISIQVPVDKEYYDSIQVGETIDDSFRMGSFVYKGSFGSWKITVADKKIQ